MNTNHLIDAGAIRKFIETLHARAAIALSGVSRPGVVQLCSKFPDQRRMCASAFNIGDIDYMTKAAVIDAKAGKNVYAEARSVRPGLPRERGKANATLGVFAIVVDHDGDRGRAGRLNDHASLTVETSPPSNVHQWYFFERALNADAAKAVGDTIREASGADTCTGVVTGCYRIAGTPNYPDARKTMRGRVVTPTRLISINDKLWTPDELIAAFSKPRSRPRSTLVELKVRRAATPAMDRSAVFMSAVLAAVAVNMTPDDLESLMRENPQGCAAKYLQGTDRLKAEIARCWAKAVTNNVTNGVTNTRVAHWRTANRDHYRAYMRDYMRRRRSDEGQR